MRLLKRTITFLNERLDQSNGNAVATFIFKGGMVSLSVAMTGVLLSLLSNIILSRTLGVEEFGGYSIILGWCLLLVPFATMGMDFAVLKFASPLIDNGDNAAVRRLALFVTMIVSISAAFAVSMFSLLSLIWPEKLNNIQLSDLLFVLILVGSISLAVAYSAFFRAKYKIFESQFFQQILRPLCLILSVLAWINLREDFDYSDALAITSLSALFALVALIIRAVFVFKKRPNSIKSTPVRFKNLINFGWITLLIAVMQQCLVQSNVIFIGMFSNNEQAGLYAVAAKLSVFTTFGLTALASVTAPMISVAFERHEKNKLQNIATANARIACLFGGIITLCFLVLGKLVLGLFGSEFVRAYPVLMILVFGGFILATGGACANLLLMTGRQKDVLISVLLAFIVLIIGNISLTQQYGALGSALSSVFATATLVCCMTFYVFRAHGIKSWAFHPKVKQ